MIRGLVALLSLAALAQSAAVRLTVDGCFKNPSVEAVIDVSASEVSAVRCCSDDGTCVSIEGSSCLPDALTYDEAAATCSSIGRRLCSLTELTRGACCETGCHYDNRSIWFNSASYDPESHYAAESGCRQNQEGFEMVESDTAAVRCCFADRTCDSDRLGTCFGDSVGYEAALTTCTKEGGRLCTFAELALDSCCSTGCGYDHVPVWFDNDALRKKPRYTADGCVKVHRSEKQNLAEAETSNVRCCFNTDDGLCDSDLVQCYEAKTYDEAKDLCEAQSGYICSYTELASGMCCNTGCNFDQSNAWFDNEKIERPAQYTADACYTSGDSYDLRESVQGSVRCCNVSGTPACYTDDTGVLDNKAVDYDTAEQVCHSQGRRLCTLTELAGGLCCKSSCGSSNYPTWFDNTLYKYGVNYAADGCVQQNVAHDLTASTHAAVRCCFDNGTCASFVPECVDDQRYDEAVAVCKQMNARLCSLTELLSGICCSTGCSHDGHLTWFDNEPRQAPLQYSTDGCRANAAAVDMTPSTEGGVRCCFDDGTCDSEVGEMCVTSVPYATAEIMCSRQGGRLCSYLELEEGKCCASGCGLDSKPTWFDNSAYAREGYYTLGGCPNCPTCDLAVSETGAVRCCFDDGTCRSMTPSETCYGGDVGYEEAADTCDRNGGRLCTMPELLNGVCCDTGCGYNKAATWFDNSAYKYGALYTIDGCSQMNSEAQQAFTGAVRCCFDSGVCDTEIDSKCLGDARTYTEAAALCSSVGARLCTVAELQYNKACCDTGCGYNAKQTWFLHPQL